MPRIQDMRDVKVIAPNFKQRLSGVTSTIIQLIPVQNRLGQQVATLGPGLPDTLPSLRWRDLLSLWRSPVGAARRVWHARRNIEMLPGIVMRDLLRMKLKLVFTSASQRRHSRWTKLLISRMDAVIATSAKTASYLDVPATVIMHGIDSDRFYPATDTAAAKTALGLPADKKIAGCFGRVRHQKGTDLFVDSMISLLPSRQDWIAIVAGRATGKHLDYETQLKKRVKTAGLADRILFVGEHTNIPDWHRALDLFVAPQRWEGFGLTPLEAMATAVPVVATDVGAFSELLASGHEGCGRLIAANSLDAMSASAAAMMDNLGAARQDGQAGLARATRFFTIETEARKLGSVYDRLLNS